MGSRYKLAFVSLSSVSVIVIVILFSILSWDLDRRMLHRKVLFQGDLNNRENTRTLSETEDDHGQTTKDLRKQQRIVIIGSGPTGLGAAKRLYDLGQGRNNSVITIMEELDRPGGLASSVRDDKGFLWDVGVHVVFSHYTYFDRVLNMAVTEWNYRRRASFAFMKGSDGNRRFIPYPVQNNIHVMDKIDQERCLRGLEEITKHPTTRKPTNFDEWLLQKFGVGLADVFMRKYNRKIWTVDTTQINSAWVGERVAVPDIEEIQTKIKEADNGIKAKDSEWEPNRSFRFPKNSGTGGIWESVASMLPRHWFKFQEKVTKVDMDRKVITVTRKEKEYTLGYDKLISTIPLDSFIGLLRSRDQSLEQMQELASRLVYTHTHVVGVGLTGHLPKTLADKSWVYFPDSDSPFYRVTMFSNYSEDLVPKWGDNWSLLCEIAEPQRTVDPKYWSKDNLMEESVQSLVLYGFITTDMVVSKHYRRLDHGYPVPSLKRDLILDTIQPWLETRDIYSRGLFGGWKYEVGKQDHSFMQGVEAADKILSGVPELTYPDPNLADFSKNADRAVPSDYAIVVSQYKEDLGWARPFANRTFVYHKGGDPGPKSGWLSWEALPNVGRESHSYLHHIIHNYDHLPDVTVFYPGAIADHPRHCPKNPREAAARAKRGVPCAKGGSYDTRRGHVVGPHDKYLLKAEHKQFRPSDMTFLEFYDYVYGHKPRRAAIPHCWKGCFAATREMIRKHPVAFYQRAESTLVKSSNPEEGHYFERLWYHMFHDSAT